MVKIKYGNILNCTEDIIVHQVNVQGIMGGGLARQLADQYSQLEKEYARFCKLYDNSYDKLKDTCFVHFAEKVIVNMFSQKPNFDTDYEVMKEALYNIKGFAKDTKRSIAIPYRIGCGIANGKWEKVYKIIEEVFSDYEVSLYKLKEL